MSQRVFGPLSDYFFATAINFGGETICSHVPVRALR